MLFCLQEPKSQGMWLFVVSSLEKETASPLCCYSPGDRLLPMPDLGPAPKLLACWHQAPSTLAFLASALPVSSTGPPPLREEEDPTVCDLGSS